MRLYKLILTRNDCYKDGVTIVPKGVMVHSTASNNPRLSRYVQPDDGRLGKNPYGNDWNQPRPGGKRKCVHAFIGKLADGSVATYQTLPWDTRGWHSGYYSKDSKTNANKMGYIGFEICEDGLNDPAYFRAVYREAVELTAHLCLAYHLDPMADGVVICHAEGHKRGIASNHGDVLHWFPRHGKSMDDFRADVARTMRGERDLTEKEVREIIREEITYYNKRRAELPTSDWAKPGMAEAKKKGVTDGTRPQSFATRQEVALMVNSAMNK